MAASTARAADTTDLTSPVPASEWIVTLGGSIALSPRYDGAPRYSVWGMPSISVRRADEAEGFSAPDDGLDFALISGERYAIGPVFTLRGGRYRSSNHDLNGLRDVPWTIESGVFAEYWPIKDRLRMRIEVRHGFRGRADGFVGDLSVDWVERIGDFTISGGPRASLADSDYMDANFGVLPTEAALNRRVWAYDPGPGLKAVGFETAVAYRWSPTVSTTAFARYDRLVRDAAASPVVTRLGSRNQVTVGTEFTYSFAVGR